MHNTKEYNRQYYLKHRDDFRVKSRQWAKDNPEKHKAIAKVYYEKHKKTILEKHAINREKYGSYKAISVNGTIMYEHRYIMEKHIGRPLSKNEVVHHIDGNKRNNSIDNLELLTTTEHEKRHRHIHENNYSSEI